MIIRNMVLVARNIVLLLTITLTKHVHTSAGPIEKIHSGKNPFVKPPSILRIPEEQEDRYVFGRTNAPFLYEDNSVNLARRDDVCESQSNSGCRQRCISLEQTCLCGSNGKTYRNQCEMSCMRKVEMSTINWAHFGKCQSPCPSDRLSRYKKMLKSFLMTDSLKKKVKRCAKLSNCAQAKLVFDYIEGEQKILECPENISPFLLFLDLKCPGPVISKSKSELNLVDHLLGFLGSIGRNHAIMQLHRVFDNDPVINCDAAKIVNNKLFNDRNCARKKKGLSEKELIQWAFDHLDTDYDRQLKESELSTLSVLPDEACAETFFSACDTDQDGFIRGDEWSLCLGCADCYKPCHVFQTKRKKQDRNRRFLKSVVTCNKDGTCASKQCEKLYSQYEQCWCVDKNCNEIEGTRSYTSRNCG